MKWGDKCMKSIYWLLATLILVACGAEPSTAINTKTRTNTTKKATKIQIKSSKTPKPSSTRYSLRVCSDIHSLSIRTGPNNNYEKVGYLLKDECVYLTARNENGSWVKFDKGWIYAIYINLGEDIKKLPIYGTTDKPLIGKNGNEQLEKTPPPNTLVPTKKPTSTRRPTKLPTNTPYVRPPTATPRIKSDTIPWDEARYYYGEYKTVCGKVVDSDYASSTSGQPTFLNLGRPYPDPKRFTVIIWGRNRGNFPSSPDNYYYAKSICVKGLIENYKGSAQIEATSSSQITPQ